MRVVCGCGATYGCCGVTENQPADVATLLKEHLYNTHDCIEIVHVTIIHVEKVSQTAFFKNNLPTGHTRLVNDGTTLVYLPCFHSQSNTPTQLLQ